MIDAYLEALPKGREPRILASRTVFVADDTKEAMRLAEIGLTRMRHRLAATGNLSSGSLVGDLIAAFDVHLGTPEQVIASLQADEHAPTRHRSHHAGPFDRSAASVSSCARSS